MAPLVPSTTPSVFCVYRLTGGKITQRKSCENYFSKCFSKISTLSILFAENLCWLWKGLNSLNRPIVPSNFRPHRSQLLRFWADSTPVIFQNLESLGVGRLICDNFMFMSCSNSLQMCSLLAACLPRRGHCSPFPQAEQVMHDECRLAARPAWPYLLKHSCLSDQVTWPALLATRRHLCLWLLNEILGLKICDLGRIKALK